MGDWSKDCGSQSKTTPSKKVSLVNNLPSMPPQTMPLRKLLKKEEETVA